MTESEAHELVGMLIAAYPDFPVSDEAQWVASMALVDADTAFQAAQFWCQKHQEWPFIAEIHEMVARMSDGYSTGRRIMWDHYVAECRRQGRVPTATYLAPDGASSAS